MGYCGDYLPLEVLLRLNRLDLWPNDPVRGRRHIRGQLTKEEIQSLGYTIQAGPRTIFISSTYNYPSEPSTIVTSILNSN